MNVATGILEVLSWIALVYFVAYGTLNLVFVLVAWRRLAAFRRARSYIALDETFASPFTPGVSVLVPAYNEEAGIVTSVTSLLDLRYPRHEVIVINDGSRDGTLARLREAFDLVPVRQAVRTRIATEPLRGAYVSRRHANLCVLDKENGGKSDALNAGVNAAAYFYFCAVDADAVLEQDALLRVVQPIVDDPDVAAAAGGIVRIGNGCTIVSGRVVDYGLPRSRLATLQVVEYFRAFLIGRIGWDSVNGLLIISGAFGVFSRALVEAVGGFARGTVGEDVELVTRLHVHLRGRAEAYRIAFVPDPVCWTEAPEDFATLSRQRRRWQRGLAETMWRYRRQIGNPRYGVLGLLVLPYFLLFELLGALFEAFGLGLVLVALLLGALSFPFFAGFLAVSILLSVLLSVSGVVLEEYVIRRSERRAEVARLVLYALLDSFGYRQLNAYWRSRALVDFARRRTGWGEMPRVGLERTVEPRLPPHERSPR